MRSESSYQIRRYRSPQHPGMKWVVSAPRATGGRSRRLFKSRTAAEDYLRQVDPDIKRELDEQAALAETARRARGAKSENRGRLGRVSRSDRSGLPWWQIAVSALTLAAISGGAFYLLHRKGESGTAPLLKSDFEINPLTAGWVGSGAGVEWVAAEHESGKRSLMVQSGKWSSPRLAIDPLRWCRLSFKSKADAQRNNPGSIGYGLWSMQSFDPMGRQLEGQVSSSVFGSSTWVNNEVRFRAAALSGPKEKLLPVQSSLVFEPIGLSRFFIDDVTLEPTTASEVAQWSDEQYARLPAPLQYRPKASRWQRIPLAINKLRKADRLRIVMLGDEHMQDLADAPIDALVERQYPGSHVELIASIRPQGSVQFFKNHAADYITTFRPDLLIVAGNSASDSLEDYEKLIQEVKAADVLLGRTTEVMLITSHWSPNVMEPKKFHLTADTRELDQDIQNDSALPEDFRGRLAQFASVQGIEFFDLEGVLGEYLFGPAAAAQAGPPTDAEGKPYDYWMRDALHPNDNGKQLLARIFEAYFSQNAARLQQAAASKSRADILAVVKTGKTLQAESEKEALAEAEAEFRPEREERSIFAETFLSGSQFDLQGMTVLAGQVAATSGASNPKLSYRFKRELDVRDGEIVIYWSMMTNRTAGEEQAKLSTLVNFDDPPGLKNSVPARIAVDLRATGDSVLYLDPGILQSAFAEMNVNPPADLFPNVSTKEKFRLRIEWSGSEKVFARLEWWDRQQSKWAAFTTKGADQKAADAVLELNRQKHLLGHMTFKSLQFQAASGVPKLDTVLVTQRRDTR